MTSEKRAGASVAAPASPAHPSRPRTVVVSPGMSSARYPSPRALLLRSVAVAMSAFLVLGAIGAWVTRTAAETQALQEAGTRTDLITDTIVMRALASGLYSEEERFVEPASEKLGEEVSAVLDEGWIVSVNLWTREGEIIWSDDPDLVGRTFTPPSAWDATVDDLPGRTIVGADRPEHENLRGDGPLVEIFRTLDDAVGRPVLVETHTRQATVDARANELWLRLSLPLVGAMLLLALVLLPALWFMLSRAHRQREARLQRRVDVLRDERRRAAARLHEGAVQDLAAATLVIVGLAGRAQRSSDPTLSADLRDVADQVRQAALDQRTLLAGLYPAELAESALESQLDDAAVPARAAGVAVDLFLADDAVAALTPGDEELVRRVGEEMLRNVARHSRATHASVSLVLDHDLVVLEVGDDGIGFDPGALSDPEFGHLGTRVLEDLAREAGARLSLRTARGSGTTWRLVLSTSAV